MKKTLLLIASCIIQIGLHAQNQKKLDAILKEGQLLFRLEKASWISSDILSANFKHLHKDYGGYASYETKDHFINTVFYSKKNPNKVIARFQHDSIPRKQLRYVDTINKEARPDEISLFQLRKKVATLMTNNADEFFSFYKKSSPNIIPIVTPKGGKVYVLTGTQESNLLLFGNDYLLTYNKKYELKTKKKLHNSLIRVPFESEGSKTISTVHTHVVNPYIDATDICTALLYKDYIDCEQHTVLGKKYVTIFIVESQKLFAMPTKKYMKTLKNINGKEEE